MKFPLIWRSTLELHREIHERDLRNEKILKVMLTEAKEEIRELRSESMGLLKMEADRYDDLVKTLVEMKRDGYEKSTFPDVKMEPEWELPTQVWEVINMVSEKGAQEYMELLQYATEALKEKVPVD